VVVEGAVEGAVDPGVCGSSCHKLHIAVLAFCSSIANLDVGLIHVGT
jgi:hypothetical protein